jgi:uncharacterized damage-inducible protein DinB
MTEFDDRYRGTTFRRFDLREVTFDDTYLTKARFKNVDLRGAVIRGSLLIDVEISGEISNLVVNGIDVTSFVESELNRLDPDRLKMQPRDVAGFREAWDILERRWAETVQRARLLEEADPALLHERVDGEWSFIETLRHLVFASDAWLRRVVLGDPTPWSPLDLPHDDMADIPEVPRDRDVRPSLDEVLKLRRDRMGTMRRLVGELSAEQLARRTTPVTEPGYPEPDSYPVVEVLGTIVNEEWHHHVYANRDLTVLEARVAAGVAAEEPVTDEKTAAESTAAESR